MADIDIGYGADTLPGSGLPAAWTLIDCNNAANDTGNLDTFYIHEPANCTGVKIGTFSGSGATYTYRDHVLIGDVPGGSKQEFGGLVCDVVTGDFVAFLNGTGDARSSTTGGAGIAYYSGDRFSAGTYADYTFVANYWMPIYGTGVTPGWQGTIRVGSAEIANPAAVRLGTQELTAVEISKIVVGKGEI